jgi:dolichol-phosphate mannosyltransferase
MAGESVLSGGRELAGQQSGAVFEKVLDWFRFGLVGVSGIAVNELILLAVTELLGIVYLLAAAVATLGSTTWNFLLAERWVFARRNLPTTATRRYLAFLTLNVALLAARIPMLWLLTEIGGIHYAWSNLITLLSLFAIRVLIADQWLWRSRSDGLPPYTGLQTTTLGDVKHRYDVAGLVSIESDVELRELAHFKTDSAPTPDIRIRVGIVALRPSSKVMLDEDGDRLTYREHLGPLSANFAVTMGSPIVIRVAPMLALSPHVVYTNVVEAFLRFLLVSKGYVLLHSAAIADEHGVSLLSAQTDTGKTSTVISLVQARGYRFLSDDMTIIDPRGIAISYPKPMTLSFHTMSVAKAGRLTRRDRAELAIQSRLHSKSGRTVGRALGGRNLPIMTMNSLVQFVVPPPKYHIDALFDCEVGGRGPIQNVVLMSRGEPSVEEASLAATVRELIENTDDAYGFPPFSTFAPHIRIGPDDYEALRRKEIELLTRAISGVRRWRVSVTGHEWADVLPSILDGDLDPTPLRSPGPALDRESTTPDPAPVPVFAPLPERAWAAVDGATMGEFNLSPTIGAGSPAAIHSYLDTQPTRAVSQ